VSRRMKLNGLAALIGTAAAFAAACAYAAQATSQFQVTATVNANCTLGSTNVAFAPYDPLGTGNIQATGTLTLTCVKGTAPISIDLDNGVSGTRQMAGAAPGNTDVITYELYKPTSNAAGAACAYTAVWGTGATNGLVPTAAPSKAPRTYNICGQAALGQDVSADSYSQTITATVNF
jgi:spore coat protein U-like protein